MKLRSIQIRNFRCFQNETIAFDRYTCLVGPNGAGKSTVLDALNLFFLNGEAPHMDPRQLDEADFHRRDTSQEIRITLTFDELSAAAQQDFSTYYRQEQLRVSAVARWDAETQAAAVSQHGERPGMEAFRPHFEAEKAGAKVSELKELYGSLRSQFPDLPSATTKAQMSEALQVYESERPSQCVVIESENSWYGWTKGSNILERHFAWVHVPAVFDAGQEQEVSKGNSLARLIHHAIGVQPEMDTGLAVIRREAELKRKNLIQENQGRLVGVSEALTARLRQTYPGTEVELAWAESSQGVTVSKPAVGASLVEGGFKAPIVRAGHGLQRAYLLALLEELVRQDRGSGPTLFLAIEEPELYQHPPQARYMATVLEKLSDQRNQVLIATHSPYFVSSSGFAGVRFIRRSIASQGSSARSASPEAIGGRLAQARQRAPRSGAEVMATAQRVLQVRQNELFFASLPVLVEGAEDEAYVLGHLAARGRLDEFRALGCHIVPVEGKNNVCQPLATAIELEVPIFVVFDGDADCRDDDRKKNIEDNACLLRLCDSGQDGDQSSTLWGPNFAMWHTEIAKEVEKSFSEGVWRAAESSVRENQDLRHGVNCKNPILIAATIEALAQEGKYSELLDRLCDAILSFASENSGRATAASAAGG